MALTAQQKAELQAARTAARVADLRAEGKEREADALEKRSAAARKHTKRLAASTARANRARGKRGRPMTAKEKVERNSRFKGDSDNPRDKYDRAEREGLQPSYSADTGLPEQVRNDAREAAVDLIEKARRAGEGAEAERFAKAAQIMSNMSGAVPASNGGGGAAPTTAVQMNIDKMVAAMFPPGDHDN